jgi:hypothetical protein
MSGRTGPTLVNGDRRFNPTRMTASSGLTTGSHPRGRRRVVSVVVVELVAAIERQG